MNRTLAAATLLLASFLAPSARAYQDPRTWEFAGFGASASLDSVDPFALAFTTTTDLDGDGTLDVVKFNRSIGVEDNTFSGVRVGYAWNSFIETEVSYDKNRAPAEYRQTLDQITAGGEGPASTDRLETVEGSGSETLVSYQVGVLYHPLGRWKTRWQPYATIAAGYIDARLETSEATAAKIRGSIAHSDLKVDLETRDQSWLVGYGLGVKFYVVDAFALRAEVRGKSSDLFDTRREDREFSVGVSFFVPGESY